MFDLGGMCRGECAPALISWSHWLRMGKDRPDEPGGKDSEEDGRVVVVILPVQFVVGRVV